MVNIKDLEINMAAKKFIIKVDEGMTDCVNCPMECYGYCPSAQLDKMGLDCNVLNLATIKIRNYDKESNTQTS